MKPQVICVPGSVAPAAQRYRPVVEAVGDAANLHMKDLEVYREVRPPAGYSIDEELEAIDRLAASKGFDRFHLLAYSAGGFISLAYAGTRPERMLSLAMFEPARIPGRLSNEEQAFFDHLQTKLDGLEGDAFMATFIREQVKPGARMPPPPAGPISAEMQKRPGGIAALIHAFEAYPFDRDLFRTVGFPTFYAYGDMSHAEQALKAGILARLLPDLHVRRYAGVHHFVPPEEIYRPQHVRELLDLWKKGEGSAGQLTHQ
ncbi:MAG TPA: alpha/beta fold hydrolase [Candidatus Dormibacteraeota bacterium]|nr:alpha/beta fold hydrolase [Candidatus Dormibacteraeota bacterium]